MFYSKLALSNLKKNSNVYIPYILTCICSVMMFYIMHSISINEGLGTLMSGETVQMILKLGDVVIGFFSIIFLFYTNSFLMKRRKKELGLYNILGMEKKHIAKMLFLETVYVAAIGFAVGLMGGILLSRLMFLLLLKMLEFSVTFTFSVSWSSIVTTAILFGSIFLATLLFNLCQIHLAAPIELIRGSSQGEKEPRAKWIIALLGAVSLCGGYAIALYCSTPAYAIMLFFPAVILVMIGTYLLFTTGSIAALKMMKGNKDFYYKKKHFTVISGMMYRMKQNAAGLANICILSTMVLVILSTTVSMYMGMEGAMKDQFPLDMTVHLYSDTMENRDAVGKAIENSAAKSGVQIAEQNECEFISFASLQDGETFHAAENMDYSADNVASFYLVSLSEYNRLEGTSISLGEQEALLYPIERAYEGDLLTIGEKTFSVRKPEQFTLDECNDNRMFSAGYYMVVRDAETMKEICRAAGVSEDTEWRVNLKLKGSDDEAKLAFAENVEDETGGTTKVISAQLARQAFLSLNGGFLFLGLFLGTLFLMATVLIIYYKQISEGYDDKERFAIMKKVGMSSEEVRGSIRSQILMVFFLPLLAAILHIAFAFRMFSELLTGFLLNDTGLFLTCTAATILVFAVFYGIVYSLTARTYYRIVNYEMNV